MESLNRDFDDPTSDLFDQFADPCTVVRGTAPSVATRCVTEDGVQKLGEYGQVIATVRRVSFIKTEWLPVRGDMVTIDGDARMVECIESDDGLVVSAVLCA